MQQVWAPSSNGSIETSTPELGTAAVVVVTAISLSRGRPGALKKLVERGGDDVLRAAARAGQKVGPGRGPVHGTKVHTTLKGEINGLNRPDLRPEIRTRTVAS